ncbi:MAG: hypothetical protein G01um101477_463 [Candidatus Doudnabacteria bacterium Gr01-1014_77]|uniref:Uncharacterized protein n=1 Tax=Candidatus Doudnabacteria bacterium Gr01-1014_77 TaxID=2017133 RepID=A0A554JB26_9BACT|nr:MAG: hypothetical protein G01um101477_463 [Candidatus Doudnabacteria bacterium Gr01-1014_77]
MDIENFFDDIKPRVIDYGRYASNIQKGVHSEDKKGESNAAQALTDADFIVQEGLSRSFLGLNYKFNLRAEEDSPYNEKFPREAEFIVSIDPIDNTLAYKKGLSGYCIVIGVHKNGHLEAGMVHTPNDGKIYCATQDCSQSWIYDDNFRSDFIFS